MKQAHIFEIKEAENYTDDEYLLLHIACYLLNKPLGQPIKLSRTDLARIIEFLKQAETGFSFEWDWVKDMFPNEIADWGGDYEFQELCGHFAQDLSDLMKDSKSEVFLLWYY